MLLPFAILDASHARAALRVEARQAVAGRPFLAAVEIATDPHWHVYWRNPGDSGAPTRIQWQAPKGWRVEPLEFPIPRRFAPGGIAAYGYEGKTLFLARVTPSSLPGVLGAEASWLVCREACVQGRASLTAKIRLGRKAVAGPSAPALRAARLELPSVAEGWRVRAATGKGVVLTASPAPEALRAAKGREAEFFPAESGVVDQAKPALATLQGNRLVFKMEASPFPERRTRLSGLIVYSAGGRRRAALVNPKLEPGD